MKNIIKNSFYQLFAVYALLVLLLSLNLFWKYTLHFEIFAVILAVLGITTLSMAKEKEIRMNKKLHYALFGLALILILVFRFIPYMDQSIPLGYDAGIYKYGIEQFKAQGLGVENWVKGAITPGFLYLTYFLSSIFLVKSLLTDLFILVCLILGVSIYFFAKEYFNKETALIALLLYAVSIIQFKVFTFMYYKNILALIALLWALYFLRKDKRIWFIVFGALIGLFHRPTFFIFGLAYIFFSIKGYKKWRIHLVNGLAILALTAIGYIGFFEQAIFPLINPVLNSFIETGTAPGTFISFFQYQFSTLTYLPFAILGFFALAKNKKFNMLFFWALVTALIVYFQFFFFNRFIIHLDLALIVLAASGFYAIIQNKKKFGVVLLVVLLFSAGFVTFNEARNTTQGITQEQLVLIGELNNVEAGAYVMSVSSEYSPYVLGWGGRRTIAPGLFEENKWDEAGWQKFWITKDKRETIELMSIYEKPLYLFVGDKPFNNNCFEEYMIKGQNKLLRYAC
jgi:hypothetical protein